MESREPSVYADSGKSALADLKQRTHPGFDRQLSVVDSFTVDANSTLSHQTVDLRSTPGKTRRLDDIGYGHVFTLVIDINFSDVIRNLTTLKLIDKRLMRFCSMARRMKPLNNLMCQLILDV